MKNKWNDNVLEGILYNELHDRVEMFVSADDLDNPIVKDTVQKAIEADILAPNCGHLDILNKIFGLSLDQDYSADVVTHKTLFGKTVKGVVRYSGYERCDLEWMKHPFCSPKMQKFYQNIVAREKGVY